MSDSEDDFMSDKFLVDVPKASTSTYSQKRNAQQLKSFRAGQAKNIPKAKDLEEQRRREGLNTSLFASHARESSGEPSSSAAEADGSIKNTAKPSGSGGPKAMDFMMKMGWKVGEGLGKQRSKSPEASSSSAKRRRSTSPDGDAPAKKQERGDGRGRAEPIRISLWAGRKGISARSPSPPPIPFHINPDALDDKKMARLGKETEDFRERQRRLHGEKEVERKEAKARDLLIEFDNEAGVKFHPLHVMPSDPLGTLPRPLLKLIYPAQALSPSPSRSRSPSPIVSYDTDKNVLAAEKMREQIRRDMLSDLGDEEDFTAFKGSRDIDDGEQTKSSVNKVKDEKNFDGVDWESQVSGTKKVLSMDPATHFEFLLSQLRHEHFFCFWCAYKYSNYDEMEAPGGCPGEDEDDH